jgi:GAF domain-containing protein
MTSWNSGPTTPGDHRTGNHKKGDDKKALYQELADQLSALLSDESDPVAILANAASATYHSLPGLNWAGFYLLHGETLVLGPFQGKPACTRIPLGRGVCGSAAAACRSVLVPDVHNFPGHIACDTASESELVVPLLRVGTLIGVLDLDSPYQARFDADDQAGCEMLAAIIVRHLPRAWPA